MADFLKKVYKIFIKHKWDKFFKILNDKQLPTSPISKFQ
jgi:hypothetical protein